jgi:hypothetical protein
MTFQADRIALLGAGIMGCCLALYLARKGRRVVLFDREQAPMQAASRWNEGKLHLGYLYANDPMLLTARHVLPGSYAFVPCLEDLLSCDVRSEVSAADDLFLVHRHSVVDLPAAQAYFNRLTSMLGDLPGFEHYPGNLRKPRVRSLSRACLERLTDPERVVAGFYVPERSIRTAWLADRLMEAVAAEPRIELAMGRRISAVAPVENDDGPWEVCWDRSDGSGQASDVFDLVINALWQDRARIDREAGLEPFSDCSNRFRASLFVRTGKPVEAPCAVVCVGPFGDMKNYNNTDFYLSWYPTGLLHYTRSPSPVVEPAITPAIATQVLEGVRQNLAALVPAAGRVLDEAAEITVRGGWVYAQGSGSLADRWASLHRRDRFGVVRKGSYISFDTGKYCTAPYMAREFVRALTED